MMDFDTEFFKWVERRKFIIEWLIHTLLQIDSGSKNKAAEIEVCAYKDVGSIPCHIDFVALVAKALWIISFCETPYFVSKHLKEKNCYKNQLIKCIF